MILPITVFGAQVLRKTADEITSEYPNLQQLIADMFETMHNADGIGLAAPQVDFSIRLFIVDASPLAEDDPALADFKKVFINPVIIERFGEVVAYNEGCLSIPGLREDVKRESQIRMKYLDENWVEHEDVFEGLPARIIQHEYDHLEGVLFTDKISPLRKSLLKSKLIGMTKGKYEAGYKTKNPLRKKIA